MKWIIRISLLLVLGAVTTVGVAWGLAQMDLPEWGVHGHYSCDTPDMSYHVEWHYALGTGIVIASRGTDEYVESIVRQVVEEGGAPAEVRDRLRGVWWTGTTVADIEDSPDRSFHGDYCYGFPLLGLGWRHSRCGELQYLWKINRPKRPTGRLYVPLRPILPGFIINTLFYAAIWFGVFFGVAALRRAIRKKRGRCVKCSYDLRGEFDRGCPECGWNRSEPRL